MDNSESQSNVEQLDLLRSWVEKRDEQDLHRARLKAVGPEGFDEAVAIVAEWLNATVPTPQPIAEDLIDGMMHLDAYLPSEYTEIDIKLLIEKAKIDFYAYQV